MSYCNISSSSNSYLGGGTGVEIVDWRYSCIPKLVRVNVLENSDSTETIWVKLEDLNLRE